MECHCGKCPDPAYRWPNKMGGGRDGTRGLAEGSVLALALPWGLADTAELAEDIGLMEATALTDAAGLGESTALTEGSGLGEATGRKCTRITMQNGPIQYNGMADRTKKKERETRGGKYNKVTHGKPSNASIPGQIKTKATPPAEHIAKATRVANGNTRGLRLATGLTEARVLALAWALAEAAGLRELVGLGLGDASMGGRDN